MLSRPRLSSISGIASNISKPFTSATGTTGKAKASKFHSTLTADMTKLKAKHVSVVVQSLKALVDFSKMQTSLADGLRVSKDMLRPKQFDRGTIFLIRMMMIHY